MKKKIFLFISSLSLISCSNVTTSSVNDSQASNNSTNNVIDATDNTDDTNTDNNILIAYFSGTGSTEKVAGYIKEETNGTLFEIEPKNEYTSADLNYNNTNSRVYQEYQDTSKRDIELKVTTPDNFSSYKTVFIGYPIWWGIAAWPVNNFVKDNDFSNKTVIPFCTSASSGLGNSVNNLKELNSTGNWLEGKRFSSSASQSTVTDWVKSLNL